MNRRMVMSLLLVAALVMTTVLAGCGNKDSDKVKVRIGEVTRSLFYAPQYVAIEKGYFEEEGLDVELTTTPGGDKTMTALLSNAIDVALVGSETSIYVYQQGTDDPIINFAQLTQTDGTFLVAREAVETFDWNALKGSVFLGQRKGGMPQMAGEFALKKLGIDPQADLELIQNVDFANIPAAFASGTGDYVQLFEPTASIFEKEGKGHVVASFGAESGHLPYTVFMAKQSYINKNEKTVQAFTNAIHKAQLWVESNTAEAITDVVLPYFENVDRDILISSIDRYQKQGSFSVDPVIDEAEWNNLIDVITSAGELEKRTEHSELVNTTFAEKSIEAVK
ncbi:NitT/TauT family transport system substrate-binding protein [Paenibacillus endophyticus]|uniref:NitT/TauT family transport system substrate-binding protein n=1 Tax=Paenibacillus endophyticus TaxID=1294268 RepID=A0A7W5C633_9BACL|nr:ABC transporter substrate-binding protein [Paenibacillus endophyticus]MBB3151723.1 NitT/TauT family transport system substrate-binding protein [Paenibacillus endophyticus]